MHANHRGWRRGGSCRSMEIEIKESWRRMRWRWYKMMGVSCREQSLATSICSPTRDVVSVQDRGRGEVRVTDGPISASLGAMRPLVAKLDNLLLNPPKECSSKKVKDGMLLLRDDVEKISSYLDKLSEVEDPLPTTMCWMNETRDLSYKMEDYIDSLLCVHPADPSFAANNISTARSILKFKSCLKLFNHAKTTPKKLEWHRQIAATVLEFRKCAQEAIQRRKVYVLSDSTTESTLSHRVMSVSHVLPTPHEETAVIVIDGRMNEFINSLVANDEVDQQQLKVVSVFGSACLGKTTLARVMYNKFGKEYHCRAFVQVSRKPDMKRIFRDMLSQLQWKDPPEYHNEVQLTENIKTYLRNRRYLIIIDDVWAASVFDIINHALPKGSHGSRIITTTQIEDVALTCCGYQSERVFEMKPLDEHHSRKLFFSVLFGSENDCPEQFKEDLNEIVVLCGGLPLATISIASLLASQPVMTEDLLKHISESLSCCLSASSTSERTRQALNLSFNNLPRHLKTCLLYLSMYPEGCTFSKHDLVKQWMAEGFIDTTEEQDKKKLAESYLHQLIGRRFIQPIRINYNNEVLSCVVHDTVHDLIAQRAVEENFIVAINYSQKSVALSHKARRLSLLFGDARYAKTPANILKSQVRSLAFSGILECMPCITEFKLLRVLNLQLSGHGGDDDGPLDLTGISEHFKLRYLKISCDVCIILPNHLLLETLNIMNARVAFDPRDIRLPHLLDLSLPIDRNLRAWSLSMSSFGYLQDLNLTTSSTPSSFPGTDIEDLGSLISGHGNLKTVVVTHGSLVKNIVVHDASKETIYWNNMEPPPLLQRFEFSPHIGCIFSRIPQWVEKHENLCILKIAVRELLMNCVGILRGLRALAALSLHVETAPIDKIIFDKAGFSVLKYFKLRCMSGIALLNFEADAMPSLWKLKLVSNDNPRMNQHQNGTAVIIIGHMPSLKEVSVKFGGAAADVEYTLRTFVNNHPSNPTINVQLVDYSSCGDESTKEKPRPDEILVEEPSGSNKQQPDEIQQDEPDESYKQQPDKIVEEEPDVSYKQRTNEIMEEEAVEYDKTLVRLADKRSLESLRIFTLDELMSATSNFSEENLLGKGIYGSFYKATIDGKLIAAITKLTYSIRLPELQHLERMRHPNLVRLLGYCDHGMDSMLLYEYMPRGSLKYHLFNNNLISSISWSTRLNIAIRAAKGLAYLRESGNHIIYTFNASSILLDLDYTPKLFGFCLWKKNLQNKTAGSDVYNFGVVLLELLAGRPSVDQKRPVQERNLVEWSRPHLLSEDKLHHIMDPSMKGQYSVQAAWRAATTARLCLESAPKKRPSMCEVVEALEPLLALGEEHRLATKNWLPFEAHTERSPLSTSKRNIAVGTHSGIVATLQYKLNELMRQEYKLLAGIRGHITLFQGELWAMTRTVHYYESIDDHDVQIRSWVGQVRELAYDTDDWVDLLNHHIVASSHNADASTSWFSRWIRHGIDRHVIATELQELRQRVIKVNEHFDSHHLQIIMGGPRVSTRLIAPYLDSTSLVGLDQPRDEVIKMVTGAGWKKLEVVSIVGMSGSGKTALAKEVYRLISSEFKYHAVVSAGQSTDIVRVLSDMLSQVDSEYRGRSVAGDLTELSLISRLREHIKDNRYLVLIDDLWSEETLWRIRSCLENQHDNRIITTTRIEEVAKASDHIYRTRLLNEADAETLFYQRAFGNVVRCPPHLKDVSDQIMRKCGGLPLALVSVGCLLARKTHTEDEFERYVLEWQDSQLEEMKQTIKLSCSNLSGQLKACLMCLSIFPENHEIEVERLVRLWIAEGFIHDDERGTSREEIGRQYINWLISINLIQTSQLNHDGTARSCVLHPVIHDIIICDSMEDNFVALIHARQQDVPPGIGTVRRLSFLNSGKYDHDAAQIDGAKVSRARSVTAFGHTSGIPPLNELSVLRVLDLEGCEGPLCLDGLCKLLLLRYLNLKGTDVSELPAQIGKLRFLETLDVRSTKVKVLPPSILRLEKLVHLLAGNAKLPSGIGKLKSLLSLSCSNIGKNADATIIQELSEMASLSDLELFCDDTQTSGYKKQATFPSSGFRSLKKLSIWCSSPSVTFVAGALPKVEVLELKFEKCLSESSGVSGIEHLSGLKHMLIEFVQRDAATVAAVSKFAETAHPNCQVITVNVHRESEE